MINLFLFALGVGVMFFLALRSRLLRRQLCAQGETVAARVAGTVQSRDGVAYVLEFATAGGSHRLHYPKPPRGAGFAVGSTVTLHYDPQDPSRMYVEGDRSLLGAELLYFGLGCALLVLLVVLLIQMA